MDNGNITKSPGNQLIPYVVKKYKHCKADSHEYKKVIKKQ